MILTDLSNTIKNCGEKFRFVNTLIADVIIVMMVT